MMIAFSNGGKLLSVRRTVSTVNRAARRWNAAQQLLDITVHYMHHSLHAMLPLKSTLLRPHIHGFGLQHIITVMSSWWKIRSGAAWSAHRGGGQNDTRRTNPLSSSWNDVLHVQPPMVFSASFLVFVHFKSPVCPAEVIDPQQNSLWH